VGVVLVGRIVEIDDLGPAAGEEGGQVGGDPGMARLFDVRARVRQLDLDRVTPERGGLALLEAANVQHLGVGEVRIGARAG
jgi:hypothetical protein